MDDFSQKMTKFLILLIKGISFLFITIVVFLLMQLPALTERPFNHESIHNINFFEHILVLAIGAIVGYASISLLCKLVQSNIRAKILTKFSLKNIVFALIFSTVAVGLESLLAAVVPVGPNDEDLIPLLKTGLAPFLIVMLVIISPVLENFFFQGVFQDGIFKRLSPFFSITLTGVVFALAHGIVPTWSTLQISISGIIFAIVYYLTKDFKMSVLSHSFFNFIILLVRII